MRRSLLAARVFGTPLLIAPAKLDVILGVIGPRFGLDFPAPAPGPESEPKERKDPEMAEEAAARIAVVQAVGTLANRVDWLDAMSGMTSYETLAEEIDRLAADPDVDAILLEVDSFGGEAGGCFDLADRIFAARQQKPVYGVANQYAMSAGYALLSQCERVFVPQSGEVGSIGVVTTHMDITAAAAQQGVRVTHVHAGAHKVDMSPFQALSDETKQRLAADVEQLYGQFLGVVGRGGRLDADAARATEALTYIGEKAVEVGLADEIGTRADALEALANDVKERKRMKQLEAQNQELKSQLAAATARIASLEEEKKQRLDQEDAAYLESLQERSAASHAPIEAAQIAKVKAHLDAGRREVARELGDAFLEAAVAKGGKPLTAQKVAPSKKADDHQLAIERGKARLLKRAGYEVETDEDGRVVKAQPKKAKAR